MLVYFNQLLKKNKTDLPAPRKYALQRLPKGFLKHDWDPSQNNLHRRKEV
jgi:hypothetical protein